MRPLPLFASLTPLWLLVAATPLPALARPPAAPAEGGCPFLRAQGKRASVPSDARSLKQGVLDNLDRLELAQRLCEKAEAYVRGGNRDFAESLYARVRELCPGSRYDTFAADRLRGLLAKPGNATSPDRLQAEVADLVESGQRRYADGCYAEARASALVALALTPDCPAAQALFDKCLQPTQPTTAPLVLRPKEESPVDEEQESAEPPGTRQAATATLFVHERKQILVIEPLEIRPVDTWRTAAWRWLSAALNRSPGASPQLGAADGH